MGGEHAIGIASDAPGQTALDEVVKRHQDQLMLYARDLAATVAERDALKGKLELVQRQLMAYARDLREIVDQLEASNIAIKQAHLDTILRLSVAAEYRDDNTAAHIRRISEYCKLLARQMGLGAAYVETILYASPMHDIGKIGIPDGILFKPGKLSPEEFEIIKQHPRIGHNILRESDAEVLQEAAVIALSHHERWDGTGYPTGLAGEDIPLGGRITAVADVFDAVVTRRVYKVPFSNERAYEALREASGSHLDPRVVEAFFDSLDEVLQIQARFEEAAAD
jgi:putative two-component system response regulator